MHVFTTIQTSAAFDLNGRRAPSRDDYEMEYLGELAPTTDLIQLVKARHPKSLNFWVFAAETDVERSRIESALGLIRL